MEWAVDGVVFENRSVGVEDVYETVLPFVERSKGDPQFPVNLSHAVRREIVRDLWVGAC